MFEHHHAHASHTPEDIPILPASIDGQSVGGLNIYYGDLHNHTGYSDGVPGSTPKIAFDTARARGLHFLAVTDHGFLLTETEWQNMRSQADDATDDGHFVALAGIEFTHAKGHMNIFNIDTLVHRDQPGFETIQGFYNWIVTHPTAFAQFNHPFQSQDWNFNDFAYHPLADHKMVTQELTTASDFFIAMNAGWHLGTLKNRDYHTNEWGLNPLMGVLATGLTQADILEAIAARRTFFVSPNNSNLALVLRANGAWMGSAIPPTNQINFTINAFDPAPNGYPLTITLYENGVRIASTTRSSATSYTWTPTIAAKQGRYYYAEASYPNWTYGIPSYSSPIWVEQPPLAKVQPTRLVPVGKPVLLDGRQSYDPDGDALIFQWNQKSGPAPLAAVQSSQFAGTALVTPTMAGDTNFRLTVADPGGLTDSESVLVSATDQPFLAIVGDGPVTTPPNLPITYTLTVTNIGISPANNVVITGQLPAGSTYLHGGNMRPDGIIEWNVASLAAGGGSETVAFAVTANSGIMLNRYGASCGSCIGAMGEITIFTNGSTLYLPVVIKR